MTKTQLMRVLIWILPLVHCSEATFQGGSQPPKRKASPQEPARIEENNTAPSRRPSPIPLDPPPIVETSEDRYNLTIPCGAEGRQDIDFPSRGEVTIKVEDACTRNVEIATEPDPIDLVFSIDVSTSMGRTLSVVKDHVVDFVKDMQNHNFDLRVGAVGFVDEPIQQLELQGVESFRTNISQWRLKDLGNDDFQEAGQASIAVAMQLLANSPRSARKVILHTSDAVGFAGVDHDNFSVDLLANSMKRQIADWNFEFYSSVPRNAGKAGPTLGWTTLSFKIVDQMKDLRRAAALQGEELQFPFDKEIFMGHFATQLKQAATNRCQLTRLSVLNRHGSPLASHPLNQLVVSSEDSDRANALEIERCCVMDGATSCQREVSTLDLR